jgi:hypothetical protein
MLKKLMMGGALAGFLALGGLAACGKADEAIKDLEALKKRACECKTTECTDKVMNDFLELGKKHKETKGSDSQVEKFKKVFEQMQECIAKVQEGGGEAAPEEKKE